MTTLAVVEEILRETAVPMSVREIVERAGSRLPSKSKTPDTVVARDLSMDIKRRGESSLFTRTSPGRYTLRSIVAVATTGAGTVNDAQSSRAPDGTHSMSAALNAGPRKPAAAAPAARDRAGRSDDRADGGGFAS